MAVTKQPTTSSFALPGQDIETISSFAYPGSGSGRIAMEKTSKF